MYWCPIVDSTRGPYFDQTSPLATVSYWVAESGGKYGAPIVGAMMLFLFITRPRIAARQRVLELALLSFVVVALAGGGAALNEHVVKPIFKVPRPNIVYLASEDGAEALGMSAAQFLC